VEPLSRALRVALWDVRRLARKKSTILVIILFILPFITALALKRMSGPHPQDPDLWAGMLGVDLSWSGVGAPLAGQALNLFSWWWLIVAIYAGDILASDMGDGTARLVLSRPVSREEYLAGKTLSMLAVLTVFSLVGAYTVYASAWLIAGHQSHPLGPLLASLVLVLGSLPMVLIGALLGILTRKILPSVVVLAAVYIVAGIIISVLALAILVQAGEGSLIALSLKLHSLIPLDSGKTLASLAYTRVARGSTVLPPIMGSVSYGIEIGGKTVRITPEPLNLDRLLGLNLAGTLAWTLALALLTWIIMRKKDI